jgi:hypothetical protein
MSLNPSRARLGALTKQIGVEWQQAKESWRDQKAQEFDVRFMSDLFSRVNGALAHLETLDRTLSKLRSDCE